MFNRKLKARIIELEEMLKTRIVIKNYFDEVVMDSTFSYLYYTNKFLGTVQMDFEDVTILINPNL